MQQVFQWVSANALPIIIFLLILDIAGIAAFFYLDSKADDLGDRITALAQFVNANQAWTKESLDTLFTLNNKNTSNASQADRQAAPVSPPQEPGLEEKVENLVKGYEDYLAKLMKSE